MKLFSRTIMIIVPVFTLVLTLTNALAFNFFMATESDGPNKIFAAITQNLDSSYQEVDKVIDPQPDFNDNENNAAISEFNFSYIMFLLVSAFCALATLSGMFYLFVNHYIIRPLSHIKSASSEVAKGNFDIKLNTLKGDEISGLSLSFLDMCINLRETNEKVQKIAFFDEITDLPNRRAYKNDIERITKNLPANKKCAVVLMDLDHFKEVNDLYGHSTGDMLLASVANRLSVKSDFLQKNLHSGVEASIYRVAGDEFIVILNYLDSESEAVDIASRIQSMMSEPIIIDDNTFTSKCSMGVAVYPLHSIHSDSLFQYADMAMYEAKKQGRGKCCVFDENFLNKIIFESHMADDIRSAINNEEFHLVFQPKYCFKTQKANEFEALIRWTHPRKGNISPGIFIPFAEERNLINDIGMWVIDNLCKTISHLEKDGWTDFKISFNTSPKQLQNIVFIRHLQHCIDHYGVNPAHLEMEITEHSIAREFDNTIKSLEHVRGMGLSIAIDDFGTGYSSLSYLRRMPIDTIKIDKIFISECLHNSKSKTVVETILTLANGLGMKTVAEGVETQEEYTFVEQKGCDYVQGYFFSKPIRLSEMTIYKPKTALLYAQG